MKSKVPTITEADYRDQVRQRLDRVLLAGFQMTALARQLGMSRQRLHLFRSRLVMSSDKVRELDEFLEKYDSASHEMEQANPPVVPEANAIGDARTRIDEIRVVLSNILVFLSAARESSDVAKLGYIRSNLDLVQNVLLPEAEAEICKSKPSGALEPEEKPREGKSHKV